MLKRLSTILLSLLCFCAVYAQKLTVSAPQQAIMGRDFRYTLTLTGASTSAQPNVSFPDFDILAGPYITQRQSFTMVNGQTTQENEQSFIYTLRPRKEGSCSIAPASITVNGKKISSQGAKIQVLPADQDVSSSSTTGGSTSSTTQVSKEDIFLRAIVSKTKVYEQEAVLLTYRLYFRGVDIAQLTNNVKLPDFTGFTKQEIPISSYQVELENYNGKNYNVANLYRVLLFPQHPGNIEIAPAQWEAIVRVQTRAQVRSFWDDVYNTYTNVSKTVTAPATTIHVSPLPSKPAEFRGAVGSLNFSARISNDAPKQNEAFTLTMDIHGSGNMKYINTPDVEWPEGFEVYDPKVTDDFKTTTSGVNGTRTIEYIVIPRAAGEYSIPPIRFCYFDPSDQQYHTQTSSTYAIHVGRSADGNTSSATAMPGVVKEDIRQLGTDIRHIDTREEPQGIASPLEQSIDEWRVSTIVILYLIPLLLSILLMIIFRKRIRENADLTLVRYRRASKVAQRRLKQASKLMKAGNQSAFYEEIERAAWSYLSDRLSIPTADLTKQNISDILRQKGVSESLIQETCDVLSTAEFARYTPSADHAMEQLYDRTILLINHLEDQRL